MGVRLVVAATDGDWFDHLRAAPHLTEVNFWSPTDRSFRALEPGELFLFRLRAPRNFIVGGVCSRMRRTCSANACRRPRPEAPRSGLEGRSSSRRTAPSAPV